MRKTVETMSMSKETELFNQAIDLFFGMNPVKRHWILLALYLAKNKKLAVLDNYIGEDLVLSVLDIDLLRVSDTKNAEEWERKSVFTRSVVAILDKGQRPVIEDIYNSFDNESQDGNSHGSLGIKQMEPTYLVWIAETLNSLSDEWFSQNTRFAVDSIIKKMIEDDYLLGRHYQPKELTEFALTLLDAKGGSVYNPYAGLGYYGTRLNSDCKYYGQESSESTVIGELLFLINGTKYVEYVNEISLFDWKGSDEYDYIISTPPFNLKCNSKYHFCDIDFLARASADAKKKAIGIFRSNICFSARNDKNSPIVELVEKDWLEYVISLPQELFCTTVIPTVMLVINKFKKNKGVVRFVDASDCFEKSGRHNVLTTDVIDLVRTQNTNLSIDVDINTIKENEHIIFPDYYLYDHEIDIPAGFEVHTLDEFLSKETSSYRMDENDQGAKFFSDLNSNNSVDMGIVFARNLEYKELDTKTYPKVNVDGFVLSIFKNVDLFYLKTEGETVAIPHSYHHFAVKSNSLDPQYLLIEMKKDYLVSQVERFGKSSAGYSSAMRIDDFLKLKVLVPNLSTQQSIVEASVYAAKMAQIENLHLQDVIEKMKIDFLNEVRSRKHDMTTPLNQLVSATENLDYYLTHKVDFSNDDVLNGMKEEVANQKVALENLKTILSIFSREDKFGVPEVININKLLCENYKSGDSYKIIHDVNYDALKDYGFNVPEKESNHEFLKGLIKVKYDMEDAFVEDAYVHVAKDDLLRLFNNIVSNAVQHGFTDPERRKKKEYCIKTYLSVDAERDMFQIDIVNNGNPLPKGLDKYRYGLKGEKAGITGGTGEGGYIVKSIVEHYNGDYEVFSEENGKSKLTIVRIFLPIHRNYER